MRRDWLIGWASIIGGLAILVAAVCTMERPTPAAVEPTPTIPILTVTVAVVAPPATPTARPAPLASPEPILMPRATWTAERTPVMTPEPSATPTVDGPRVPVQKGGASVFSSSNEKAKQEPPHAL